MDNFNAKKMDNFNAKIKYDMKHFAVLVKIQVNITQV